MTIDFSKPITTRDGRAVRILCTDGPHPEFKVIGIIEGCVYVNYWSVDGKHCSQGTPRLAACDLINPTVKRRGWVAIYRRLSIEGIFETEAVAKEACPRAMVIVQLPEWEEPV